jgi:preprotein translocase subunit SecG
MLTKRYFYCFLIFFILIIWCNVQAESQASIPVSTQQNNQNPPEGSNQQADKDKNTGESLKAPPKEVISQRQNYESRSNGNQKHKWYNTFLNHLTDWLLALFSGLLVLFTYRLSKATIKLWETSQQQSNAMERSIAEANRTALAMQRIADSMAISTQAATENVAIFKDVREKQLRAWVLVDSIYINNVINPSKTDMMKIPEYKPTGAQIINPMIGPQAIILIKNSGPTPAINLKHWASICVKEYPLKSDLPVKRSDLAETKATIASQGINTLPLHWADPLTAEQIIELKKGTIVIYVHGEITYTDIFSINRKTSYRVMHGAMSGLLGIYTGVTICEEGNEVD